MFTQLVRNPLTLERYRNGPFAQEREQYLTHLSQRGYGKGRLTGINIQLLAIAQRLRISVHKRVTKAEVSEAAEIWMKERRQLSSLPHSLALRTGSALMEHCMLTRAGVRYRSGREVKLKIPASFFPTASRVWRC